MGSLGVLGIAASLAFCASVVRSQEGLGSPNGGFSLVEEVGCGDHAATLRINARAGSVPILTIGEAALFLPLDAALSYGGISCVVEGGNPFVALTLAQGNAFEWFLLVDPATSAVRSLSYEEWRSLVPR
jgi:hypothetical protein